MLSFTTIPMVSNRTRLLCTGERFVLFYFFFLWVTPTLRFFEYNWLAIKVYFFPEVGKPQMRIVWHLSLVTLLCAALGVAITLRTVQLPAVLLTSIHPPVDAVNGSSAIPKKEAASLITNPIAPATEERKMRWGLGGSELWRFKLYTPTFITKALGHWFIVDCWHHRVLFSRGDTLDEEVAMWNDLDAFASAQHKPMRIPHSLATDGEVVVVESSVGGSDGGNHSLLVYIPTPAGGFDFVEEVVASATGARRPHRVVFDKETSAFYVYFTSPPHLSKFVRERGEIAGGGKWLRRVLSVNLPFMKGVYARSFAIVDGMMYITAGPGAVWQVAVSPASSAGGGGVKPLRAFSVKPLGFTKGKMNDIAFIEGWWYATSTVPCSIVRFRNITNMRSHERLAGTLGMCRPVPRTQLRCGSGTPYFVSSIEGRVFVPYIFGCSGVVSFVAFENGTVGDVRPHFGGGWVEKEDDILVRGSEW